LKHTRINLVEDTIDKEDVNHLIEWLKTNPRLTKGKKTEIFEQKWSNWLGRKYSVYVNSGSSANLAMVYTYKLYGNPRSNKIIVPAVSWATTVAPLIQLGFDPILCECDDKTLGVEPESLKEILEEHPDVSALIMVHVLGFPCSKDIEQICVQYGVTILEDSCESVGSTTYKGKTGTLGLMSTFSFYFGHHISSIEGGMVCTDNKEVYNILKMIRSHGWDRDIDTESQMELRKEYNISEFKSLYSFYYAGFNIRATDLQAYIGIRQLDKLNDICQKRDRNFRLYDKLIKNDYWKIPIENPLATISNFAYPIIHPRADEISDKLVENNIEVRPLVCGSMEFQPFLRGKLKYETKLPFAELVDLYGLYVPNHPQLEPDDITRVCNVINGVINDHSVQ